jgi:hypothetical protein
VIPRARCLSNRLAGAPGGNCRHIDAISQPRLRRRHPAIATNRRTLRVLGMMLMSGVSRH